MFQFFLGKSKSWRFFKFLYWVKSYGDFGERRDFLMVEYHREGFALQPGQQACFNQEELEKIYDIKAKKFVP